MLKGSSSSVRVYYPPFSKQELIQKISEQLRTLEERLKLSHVVLFGSYARDNYTVASDVDLLVVYEGEEIQDAFAVVKKTMSIPRLEPHVYSEHEYERLKETIHKMTEDGVVLLSKEME
jgi:predicted nucleotidyltransferase